MDIDLDDLDRHVARMRSGTCRWCGSEVFESRRTALWTHVTTGRLRCVDPRDDDGEPLAGVWLADL